MKGNGLVSERLAQLDINPLMVLSEGRGGKGVDTLIVLTRKENDHR